MTLFSVPGQWSHWSAWSRCSVVCGAGTQVRTRLCSNPPPQYGGNDCFGSNADSRMCNARKCTIGKAHKIHTCANAFKNISGGDIILRQFWAGAAIILKALAHSENGRLFYVNACFATIVPRSPWLSFSGRIGI